MATEKEVKAEAKAIVSTKDLERVQDKLNVHNMNESDVDALLEGMENVEGNDAFTNLSTEYLKLETNQTYNLIFTGMGKMTGERGEIEAVLLSGRGGVSFINGNTVLVQRLKTVTQIPCAVRIVTGDTQRSKNGTYLSMKVYVLPTSVQ